MQIKFCDFFTLQGYELVGVVHQVLAVSRLQFPAGQSGFFNADIVCFQKLGCFGAGSSASTEVVPVDALGHVSFLFRFIYIDWNTSRVVSRV